MKKLAISIALVLVLVGVLAGCAPQQEQPGAATGAVKTGLGQLVSIAKSKDASDEADGAAQVDTIMAAVGVDAEGKIVSVTIDTAQVRVAFNAQGQITSDLAAAPQTKVELGDSYNMKSNSTIGKEWYEQIAALEQWMVGKTIDQIKAMKTVDNVPDEADLKSSVTISVQDYIAVVEEAVQNAR